MIKENFEPIFETLKTRDFELEEQCRIQAKKELGIYDKMVNLSKLKLQIGQLKEELLSFTEKNYTNSHKNKIDRLTDEKMKIVRNGFHDKVHATMKDMIYKVKLSGLDSDTKSVFDQMPDIIKSLTSELKQLPDPSKKIKLIKANKK
jgi:hypothetical protein